MNKPFPNPARSLRLLAARVRFASLLFLLAPGTPSALAQLLGPEFWVNTPGDGAANDPSVAAAASGDFVVVWEKYLSPSGQAGPVAQRFDSLGHALGVEIPVGSTLQGGAQAAVAMNPDSQEFVVVWSTPSPEDPDRGVVGRRFSWTGSAIGSEFQVNTYTTYGQTAPAIAIDPAGEFVVVWVSVSQDGSQHGVFGQRFDPSGVKLGGEFQVNTYTTDMQINPAVTKDFAGDFVVVWQSGYLFYNNVLEGQRFNSQGERLGGEFAVSSSTTTLQYGFALAGDAAGNFIVTWRDYSLGTFARRFDSAGAPLDAEFPVNTTLPPGARPALAMEASGRFVVTWNTTFPGEGSSDLAAQRFDAAGQKIGGEFQVNSPLGGYEFPRNKALAADGAGNFILVWDTDEVSIPLGLRPDPSLVLDATHIVFGRQLRIALFSGGFDSGDACAWSAAVGGACP